MKTVCVKKLSACAWEKLHPRAHEAGLLRLNVRNACWVQRLSGCTIHCYNVEVYTDIMS